MNWRINCGITIPMENNITPMLRQYQEVKTNYKDCILFFRLGDFYEMFMEDATKACGILDVVLTSRDAGKSGRIPMCGIPFHAADTYVAKLIKAGLKVAICEQVEDPSLAKGLVKREVIRVITTGTFIDETSFESRNIICLDFKDKKFGLSFTDNASGSIQAAEYTDINQLLDAIAKIDCYECVFSQSSEKQVREIFKHPGLPAKTAVLSPIEDWYFNTDLAKKSLIEHFKTHNLRGFGLEDLPLAISASGALLEYLKLMNRRPLQHIDRICLYTDSDTVFISPAACFGLELAGLLKILDHTQTALGKRRLKNWLYHPLKDTPKILKRQDAVRILRNEPKIQEELGRLLQNIPDIEKSISRISCGCGSSKDLLALRNTLLRQPYLEKLIAPLAKNNPLFHLENLPNLREFLAKAINPDIPLAHPEGKIINTGFHAELDALREILENGKAKLREMQAKEIKRTGINSLKIGFNQVFGYYIEISKSNLDKTPADYIRRQTLANAERFITVELKSFEDKILNAEDEILKIEKELLEHVYKAILDNSSRLHAFSSDISSLDAIYSLSVLSQSKGYVAPLITDDRQILIKDGRHPVVEKTITDPFIPNDSQLDSSENHLIILTGPNMAGKSTYIRQTAILVIMAQMGSFIPADSASIGIVDKIFTRIGAHDEISRGQSTFMVEMSETAGILNNLSERSLVILDEIGRGTSTFDGLSLGWAIAEYLAKQKVRTLFATHFHELTALAEEFPGVKNCNVAVKEWNDEVIFLHKILAGGTDESYGIYVAKLAGIPKEVVLRSQQILTRLEVHGNLQEKIRSRIPAEDQLSLFTEGQNVKLEELKKDIESLDLNTITPLKALNKLQELKDKLNKNE